MKVLDCRETRELERRAIESGISETALMETAGAAVSCFLRRSMDVKGKHILVLCGKGNNGGDGFVIACRLWECEANVTIALLDGLPKTELARQMLANIRNTTIRTLTLQEDEPAIDAAVLQADAIVDAVYGIGFRGAVPEKMRALFFAVNGAQAPVVAVDIPSGLNGDTGRIEGVHIKADHTITFSTKKPVHLFEPAKSACGQILVASVGIDEELIRRQPCRLEITEPGFVQPLFLPRQADTNKGSYGRLLTVCGQEGMAGAAILSNQAAARCGTGLVHAAVPAAIYPLVASRLVEPIFTLLDDGQAGTRQAVEASQRATACLIGCGLGNGALQQERVLALLEQVKVPVVLDADGINAVSAHINVLKTASAPLILTPHPGEMARLLQMSVAQVQENRLEIARSFAAEYGVILVLKGHHTLIAIPGEHPGEEVLYYNPTGNPGMAKGGSGDVLAGMIAAFCAQGVEPWRAAVSGVYLHGLAGDRCAKRYSERAMLPSDLLEELPRLFLECEKQVME